MGTKRQLLIAAAAGGTFLLLFGPALLRLAELKAEEGAVGMRIATLKSENGRLIQESKRLREDPAYLEEVARKELGFARPGETVVKFRSAKISKR